MRRCRELRFSVSPQKCADGEVVNAFGCSPNIRRFNSCSALSMTVVKKGLYRHYKGKVYRVLGIGRHSETLEELVFYQGLYDGEFGKDALWVRPLKMFLEDVEVDGKTMPRFTFIGEEKDSVK